MYFKKIIDGLYRVKVRMVNTFLLETEDGLVLIDTGFPGGENNILGAIKELGKEPSDLRHIIITHAHPDHIGSAGALKRVTGAQVYMHFIDAPIATKGTGIRPVNPTPGLLNNFVFRFLLGKIKEVESVKVDHLLEGDEVLPLAGGIRIIHIPGQSKGQIALLWKRHGGVMFVGDACTNLKGMKLSPAYEDIELGIESLKRLSKLKFEVACFGHGDAILSKASDKFKEKWDK